MENKTAKEKLEALGWEFIIESEENVIAEDKGFFRYFKQDGPYIDIYYWEDRDEDKTPAYLTLEEYQLFYQYLLENNHIKVK